MDLLEKIPELLRMTWPELAKVLIGAFLVGFMALGWVRQMKKHAAAKVKAAREQTRAELEAQKAEMHARLADAERQHAEKTAELHKMVSDLRQWEHAVKVERDKVAGELEGLRTKLAALQSFDGKLWERDLLKDPPPFVPAGQRRTRFIAVGNLKGGVGKTTVAANVGMLLARRGKNVLLVDLDFQGSLTRLCVPQDQFRELVRRKETVSALFHCNAASIPETLTRVIHPVVGTPPDIGACHFIAAYDDLAEVELREEARWLVTREPDIRFLFRRVFHTPEILNQYDYVFFDCPPRLTTACVNAWGCSDWLLVPIVPDQTSVQALPRTLHWLRRLSKVSHARLLGIVANQIRFMRNEPVIAHRNVLNQLPEFLKRVGFEMNGAFKATLRMDAALIARCADAGRIATVSASADPLFNKLVTDIEKAA